MKGVTGLKMTRETITVGLFLALTGCLDDPNLKTCEDTPQAEACRSSIEDTGFGNLDDMSVEDAGVPAQQDGSLRDGAILLSCIDGERRPCVGDTDVPGCSAGWQICLAGGQWGECVGADEECNGEDDDCDGVIDEDTQVICGVSQGLCEEGLRLCENGQLTPCSADREPNEFPETCNGFDDDCDGEIDEDIDPLAILPIPIVRDEGVKLSAIAASSNHFGVVYSKPGGRSGDAVEFVRLSADGRFQGDARTLSYRNVAMDYTVVATAIAPWDGMGVGGFVAAWIDHEGSGEPLHLRFAYLSSDGEPVGTVFEWPIEGITGGLSASEHRLSVSSGDGGSVAIVLDAGLGSGVHYVYKGGFAGNALSGQMLSEDDYGASIVHMGGRRFVAAHSRYRSTHCPDAECTEANSPGGIYLTELDGANLLRQERVLFGDEYDFPHLVRDNDQLILFSWTFVAPQYLVTYLPLNAQDWSPLIQVPTRVDISSGTRHAAVAALAGASENQKGRVIAVWSDERDEVPAAFMRTLTFEGTTWYVGPTDSQIPFGRDSVERVQVASMGDAFGVLFESVSRGGIFFASGALDCPSEGD